MKKLYVGNLSADTREHELRELFARFGTVRSLELAHDLFTGKCKGFGFIEMEGHHARSAIAALDGFNFKLSTIRVKEETERGGRRRVRRR